MIQWRKDHLMLKSWERRKLWEKGYLWTKGADGAAFSSEWDEI